MSNFTEVETDVFTKCGLDPEGQTNKMLVSCVAYLINHPGSRVDISAQTNSEPQRLKSLVHQMYCKTTGKCFGKNRVRAYPHIKIPDMRLGVNTENNPLFADHYIKYKDWLATLGWVDAKDWGTKY